MATEETKISPGPNALFGKLEEPFDPSEIKWRVTHTTQDGRRGAVIAFADPRAYTDRLNQIFTPTGWTRSYAVTTISAVSRMKRDKMIQTGKVLVTCTLTIHGLGCHSGSGEEFADEPNAMTRSEAQAFKRAATCFGLGRYLYNFAEMWVPLNEHRQPLQVPTLPKWALPPTGSLRGKSESSTAGQPSAVQRGPIDQEATTKIESFERLLGASMYGEVLWRIARAQTANAVPNAQLQAEVAAVMERAARGIRKAHSLAEEVGDTPFVAVMDQLQIGSMTTIRNLESLKKLVSGLEDLAARQAA
ncbi:MAG: Rad52/Rad22 family DNA repair protein [Acidobacteriaceae bacterium]